MKRAAFHFGPIHVVWFDRWTNTYGLEVAWRNHAISVGFRDPDEKKR